MKKYDIIICVLFFIVVWFLSLPIVSAHLPLSGKIIYIDPGHGGSLYVLDYKITDLFIQFKIKR